MPSIYSWSKTADDNGTADSDVPWPEGMARRQVNNSARALMGRVAEFIGDMGGALTAGGTANGITVTANSDFTTYQDGLIVAFKAASDNTGAVTLNVNAIGTKAIRKMNSTGDVALTAGDMQADAIYLVQYNSSLNSAAGAWQLINVTVPDLGTAAVEDTGTSGHTIPFLDGTNTWSGPQTFNADVTVNANFVASDGTELASLNPHHTIEATNASGTNAGTVLRIICARGDNSGYRLFDVRNSVNSKFRVEGDGSIFALGIVTASAFSGDGSALTNLPAADLTNLNASNLTSGTVPNARISGAYSGITTLTTTSTITAGGNIVRGDTTISTIAVSSGAGIFQHAANGTVNLRPNNNSSAGEFTVATSGNATVNGTLTVTG